MLLVSLTLNWRGLQNQELLNRVEESEWAHFMVTSRERRWGEDQTLYLHKIYINTQLPHRIKISIARKNKQKRQLFSLPRKQPVLGQLNIAKYSTTFHSSAEFGSVSLNSKGAQIYSIQLFSRRRCFLLYVDQRISQENTRTHLKLLFDSK